MTTTAFRATDEIANLKNLVSDVLHKRGVLNKVKAELRSNVFQVLRDAETTTSSSNTTAARLNQMKSTKEGRLMLELIVDFLDFYEFVYTKPVFTAEAALSDGQESGSRAQIAKELHFDEHVREDEPLLLQLLRQIDRHYPDIVKSRPTSPTVRTLMSHEKSPGPNIDLLPSSPLQTTEFVLPPRAQGAEEATGVNRSPPNNLNLKPLGSPKKLEALATSFSSPDRKSVLPPPVFSPVTSRFPTPVAKPLTGGSVEDVALEKVIEALALPADEDDFVPEEILEDETSSLHDLDRSIANTSPPRQLNMDDLADDDEDEKINLDDVDFEVDEKGQQQNFWD